MRLAHFFPTIRAWCVAACMVAALHRLFAAAPQWTRSCAGSGCTPRRSRPAPRPTPASRRSTRPILTPSFCSSGTGAGRRSSRPRSVPWATASSPATIRLGYMIDAVPSAAHRSPRLVRQRRLRHATSRSTSSTAHPDWAVECSRQPRPVVRLRQAGGPQVPERPDDRVPHEIRPRRHPFRLHPLRRPGPLPLQALPGRVRSQLRVSSRSTRRKRPSVSHRRVGRRQSGGQAHHRRGAAAVLQRRAGHRRQRPGPGQRPLAQLARRTRHAAGGCPDDPAGSSAVGERRATRSS